MLVQFAVGHGGEIVILVFWVKFEVIFVRRFGGLGQGLGEAVARFAGYGYGSICWICGGKGAASLCPSWSTWLPYCLTAYSLERRRHCGQYNTMMYARI